MLARHAVAGIFVMRVLLIIAIGAASAIASIS